MSQFTWNDKTNSSGIGGFSTLREITVYIKFVYQQFIFCTQKRTSICFEIFNFSKLCDFLYWRPKAAESQQLLQDNDHRRHFTSFLANFQKQPRVIFHKKTVLKKFSNIHRKTPVSESLFLINLQSFRPATLLKRDSTQVFSCEYCEIFKNTYFEEHPRTSEFWEDSSLLRC